MAWSWGSSGPTHRRQAYAGVSVPGFPNFFLTAGPYSGGFNWFAMLEANLAHIMACIDAARARGVTRVEVRPRRARALHAAHVASRRRHGVQEPARVHRPTATTSIGTHDPSLPLPHTPWWRAIRGRWKGTQGYRFGAPGGRPRMTPSILAPFYEWTERNPDTAAVRFSRWRRADHGVLYLRPVPAADDGDRIAHPAHVPDESRRARAAGVSAGCGDDLRVLRVRPTRIDPGACLPADQPWIPGCPRQDGVHRARLPGHCGAHRTFLLLVHEVEPDEEPGRHAVVQARLPLDAQVDHQHRRGQGRSCRLLPRATRRCSSSSTPRVRPASPRA